MPNILNLIFSASFVMLRFYFSKPNDISLVFPKLSDLFPVISIETLSIAKVNEKSRGSIY